MTINDLSKILQIEEEYSEKIVAFIDVMGSKKRLFGSVHPKEAIMSVAWLKYFEEQSEENGDSLQLSMFSDCMYAVADKKDIKRVCGVLSALAINLLFTNTSYDNSTGYYKTIECFKLRGGITYGNVYAPEKGEDKTCLNLLLGPAIARAYCMESEQAIYPRIIVDEKVTEIIVQQDMEKRDCGIFVDGTDEKYFLDFLRFPFENY